MVYDNILGYIEMLHLYPVMHAEERERLLGKVYIKTQETLVLIHDFFDLAKLESGDQNMPMTRILMNERCGTTILAYYDILMELVTSSISRSRIIRFMASVMMRRCTAC